MMETSIARMDGAFAPSRAETMEQLRQVAEVMHASGLFPSVRSAAEAAARMILGQTLGLGPVDSLTGISVVEGKPVLGVHLLAQMVRRGGYDYRVPVSDETRCVVVYYRAGEEVGRSEFTIDDARRAGLLGKQNWQRYPREMLYARAMARGARMYCPEAVGGHVYVPGEIEPSGEAPPEPPPAAEQVAVVVGSPAPPEARHEEAPAAAEPPAPRRNGPLVLVHEGRFAAKSARSRLNGAAFEDLTPEQTARLAAMPADRLADWGLELAREENDGSA